MKKLRKISCLVLACLMLLTACGGDSGTEEEVQAPVVTTGEEGAMEREVNPAEPVDRDDVIFVQINEPRSLDPLDG